MYVHSAFHSQSPFSIVSGSKQSIFLIFENVHKPVWVELKKMTLLLNENLSYQVDQISRCCMTLRVLRSTGDSIFPQKKITLEKAGSRLKGGIQCSGHN